MLCLIHGGPFSPSDASRKMPSFQTGTVSQEECLPSPWNWSVCETSEAMPSFHPIPGGSFVGVWELRMAGQLDVKSMNSFRRHGYHIVATRAFRATQGSSLVPRTISLRGSASCLPFPVCSPQSVWPTLYRKWCVDPNGQDPLGMTWGPRGCF